MLISMIGILGAGKSVITFELSKLLKGICYLEPSIDAFPSFVKNRDKYGEFSVMTWFRNARVEQLLSAISNIEQVSVMDSCFDSLFYLVRNSVGLKWLISRENDYWQAAVAMWKADYLHLPRADIICGINISKKLWEKFITTRNALFDNLKYFYSHCFMLQKPLLQAAKKFAASNRCLYIEVTQDGRPPREIAEVLYKKIKESGYV